MGGAEPDDPSLRHTSTAAAAASTTTPATFFPKRLTDMRANYRFSPLFMNHSNKKEGNDNRPKRSVRISISPDDEEVDSMQVTMLSPINTKSTTKPDSRHSTRTEYSHKEVVDQEGEVGEEEDDNCIYTVGSVEYSVHHAVNSSSSSSCGCTTATTKSDDCDDNPLEEEGKILNHSTRTARTSPVLNNDAHLELVTDAAEAVCSGEGGSKKSVSRMGSFFKKGNTSGGDGGKTTEGNDDSGGNNFGGGGPNDINNYSGDGDKKDNNSNRNNDHRPNSTSPRDATFGPERIQFAKDSTLPIHSGPESQAPTHHPSWTPVPGTEFKVRHGPNYLKNGKKEWSCESLYEVYCVRYYRSAKGTVGGASRIMPLPELVRDNVAAAAAAAAAGGSDNVTVEENPSTPPHHPELFGTKVPDVLVVHFMLPYETPNMFKTKEDGAGGECIYYLKPSQRFLDEISGRIPPTSATKLFVRWCSECEFNAKMRGRFKCMALVRDIDRHNLSLLKSYNGKPVLITESGRVCSGSQGGVRYLEMIANGEFLQCDPRMIDMKIAAIDVVLMSQLHTILS